MAFLAQTFRFIAGAIPAAFVLTAVSLSAAHAQRAEAPDVAVFLANPATLLQQNPNGGQLLVSVVQRFVLADPTTFPVFISLLANANDLQKRAIGEGLAKATKIEVISDQSLAMEWQNLIAGVNDSVFNTAATDAFGDVQLGAVGGGALGGDGGGPSSRALTGTGAPQDLRSTAVRTQPYTYSASTAAGPSPTFTFTLNNPNNPTSSTNGNPSSPVSP